MAKAKKTAAAGAAPTEQTTIAAAEKAAKPAVVKDTQNGITRPMTGATGRVWVIADEISAKKKEPAARAEVTEVAEAEGLVKGTIHTQFGRWRKYYGLVTPADERAAKLAEAKAAKAAAKPAGKPKKGAKADPAAEVDQAGQTEEVGEE